MKDYRTGWGFDVHRFAKKKRALILGGYKVPGARGLEAVSDGDVVIHAAADAVCGAAGLGDIGDYFPPRDVRSKGIGSVKIIDFVMRKAKKFKLVNVDITIAAEKPPLAAHKAAIVSSLRKILGIKAVNVKIKSKEGLDILGGKAAIACFAAVLLRIKK